MESTRFLMAAGLLAVLWIIVDPLQTRSNSIPEPGQRLVPCPGSPNCVSSESDNERHFIEPLAFEGSPEEAFDCLKRVLMATKRAKVTSTESSSIRVEFRTRLGFVDDACFAVDPKNGVIHMRSASRIGYWDLGANRKRLEKIRFAFGAQCL